MTSTDKRILTAAADFIRKHPNGESDLLKNLMADTIMDLIGSSFSPRVPAVKETRQTEIPTLETPGVSDENVKILLRAAGYKYAKKPTVAVYGFLVRNQSRSWTGKEVVKRCGVTMTSANAHLAKLTKMKAIVRRELGRYQAT